VKDRADKILFDKGLVSSRSQVKNLIDNGSVTVNGLVLRKAGEIIDSESEIVIHSPLYVGRGALKLEKALSEFQIEVNDKIFIDVGASTGGFTEVLLNNSVQKVYAIDVGHDQLAAKLRSNPRVINMEGTNIKDLRQLPDIIDGAVMDLSFISITKVLSTIETLIRPSGNLIALIKPQFEAGKERIPKDGVIKDPKVHTEVLNEVIQFATSHGWHHHKTIDSPIEGKAGNKEFLSWFSKV